MSGKKPEPILRSTRLSLKFANKLKRLKIGRFVDEYTRVVRLFVDVLWELKEIPSLLPRELTSPVATWLSARAVQAAGKQASGIVRGTREKQFKRQRVYEKFLSAGLLRQARRLKRKIDAQKVSKPVIENVEPQLDERFVEVEFKKGGCFDGWISLGSLTARKQKLSGLGALPVRRTRHLNNLLKRGRLLPGLRLSKTGVTLVFEIPRPAPAEGKPLGLDVGIRAVASCSDGQQIVQDGHGHTLESILRRLARKKRGGKGFERVAQHRSNFVNWSLNQLDLTGIGHVNCEAIRGLRLGRSTSRFMSGFVYSSIFDKLGRLCEENGVRLSERDPAYTSRRCSRCGWVCKRSRRRGRFQCVLCGFAADADVNAATNLSLDLEPLPAFVGSGRGRQRPRDSFFWSEAGKAPIVPSAQELQWFSS